MDGPSVCQMYYEARVDVGTFQVVRCIIFISGSTQKQVCLRMTVMGLMCAMVQTLLRKTVGTFANNSMEFNGLYNRACSRLMYFSDSFNTSANVQSVSKIYLRVVNYEDTLEIVSYAIFYQRCTSEANMPSNTLASPPCCCNVAHSKCRLIPLVCPACLHVFVIKQTSRSLRNANLQWLRCW